MSDAFQALAESMPQGWAFEYVWDCGLDDEGAPYFTAVAGHKLSHDSADTKWGWGSSAEEAVLDLARRLADPRDQFRGARNANTPLDELMP